jgi:hypothetical protein
MSAPRVEQPAGALEVGQRLVVALALLAIEARWISTRARPSRSPTSW